MAETFEEMLTGGHPNSLGRTVEVVDLVLAEPARLEELFGCYGSADAVVRLRTSSAVKRVEWAWHDLLLPIDRLIGEVAMLDQPSAQWTLAELFAVLRGDMNAKQEAAALAIMKRNLETSKDWIVLNRTMETLADWARQESPLAIWLRPHLERLAEDPRRSVASRAAKKLRAPEESKESTSYKDNRQLRSLLRLLR
ncbi:MAG: hypothetical protein AAFY02_09075 [Pseudomonadota bacterium]